MSALAATSRRWRLLFLTLARLELCWRDRSLTSGVVNTSVGGPTPRRFLDLVVNGMSGYDVIRARGYDLISCFNEIGDKEWEATAAARLLCEAEPDSRAGQCSLYVCPECGDLDCGCVTVRVTRHGDQVTWSDFAWEHPDYGSDKDLYYVIDELGPCTFDHSDLRRMLLDHPQDNERA